MEISSERVKQIRCSLDNKLSSKGFELHPFKVGWYNECVDSKFLLAYDKETVAFAIISTPQMFEEAFLPFIRETDSRYISRDPIDECVAFHLDTIPQEFPEFEVTVIKDFELGAHRRPRVLVQTAAHVSGAIHYYQRFDVQNQPWPETMKIHGVCVHPQYGGWFALRGVAIFARALCPSMIKKPSPDPVPSEEKRIELLEKFNFNWEDWSFRDIVEPMSRYSEKQRHYFATKPSDRLNILKEILQ